MEPGDKEEEFLSPRVKKLIGKGKYKVDLESLASSLLEEGVLEEETWQDAQDPAQNDQKPKKE